MLLEESQVYAWDFLVYGTILYHPVKYSKYILHTVKISSVSGAVGIGVVYFKYWVSNETTNFSRTTDGSLR